MPSIAWSLCSWKYSASPWIHYHLSNVTANSQTQGHMIPQQGSIIETLIILFSKYQFVKKIIGLYLIYYVVLVSGVEPGETPVVQSCLTLWDPMDCSTPGFRLPCSSPSPGACANSCPLSQWWIWYISIYPLFFRIFSHLGHYRVLSRVFPCYIVAPY